MGIVGVEVEAEDGMFEPRISECMNSGIGRLDAVSSIADCRACYYWLLINVGMTN